MVVPVSTKNYYGKAMLYAIASLHQRDPINTELPISPTFTPKKAGYTWMDFYSRKIIGWSLRERLTKEIVIAALDMALKQRKLSVDLLLHSDHGSQYASELYQLLLLKNSILCSMSRKGNCFR